MNKLEVLRKIYSKLSQEEKELSLLNIDEKHSISDYKVYFPISIKIKTELSKFGTGQIEIVDGEMNIVSFDKSNLSITLKPRLIKQTIEQKKY